MAQRPDRAVERAEAAMDGVGPVPRRLAPQGRASRQGRRASETWTNCSPRRAQEQNPDPARARLATFAEVIEAWFAEGCPNVAPTRKSRHARVKSPNTIANARQLLGTSVLPVIGELRVDQTTTRRLEELFESMAAPWLRDEHDRSQLELPQPGVPARAAEPRRIKTNPAADVLLPAIAPVEAAEELHDRPGPGAADRGDPRRPSAGDVADGPDVRAASRRARRSAVAVRRPRLRGAEHRGRRAGARGRRQVRRPGRAEDRSQQAPTIGLHPLLVAALVRHRDEQKLLGLYDDEGFVFCTRNGTPMTMSNMRRAFQTAVQASRPRRGLDDLRATPLVRVARQRPARRPRQGRRPRRPRRHPHDRGLPPQRAAHRCPTRSKPGSSYWPVPVTPAASSDRPSPSAKRPLLGRSEDYSEPHLRPHCGRCILPTPSGWVCRGRSAVRSDAWCGCRPAPDFGDSGGCNDLSPQLPIWRCWISWFEPLAMNQRCPEPSAVNASTVCGQVVGSVPADAPGLYGNTTMPQGVSGRTILSRAPGLVGSK